MFWAISDARSSLMAAIESPKLPSFSAPLVAVTSLHTPSQILRAWSGRLAGPTA